MTEIRGSLYSPEVAEVLAALERAEGPSFELDAQIWCVVNGYEYQEMQGPKHLTRRRDKWNVVERFRGHLINSTTFYKQSHAQDFVVRELRRLR